MTFNFFMGAFAMLVVAAAQLLPISLIVCCLSSNSVDSDSDNPRAATMRKYTSIETLPECSKVVRVLCDIPARAANSLCGRFCASLCARSLAASSLAISSVVASPK